MSVHEVAERLGVSASTVHKLYAMGALPASRVPLSSGGIQLDFDAATVEAYVTVRRRRLAREAGEHVRAEWRAGTPSMVTSRLWWLHSDKGG